MFDVIVSVSHHAIDSGVDPDKCMKVNLDFSNVDRFSSRLEELGEAAEKTFERQLELIKANAKPRKRAVEAMRGYIKSHLNVSFSLADVADSVDLSPYYASRIFREDQNMTIMEYAVQLRMNEACYLLANPNLRIDEIAAQLGYVDSSYFTRVFKKHVGMSPRQYRLSH
jgi:AraC-like DNA-binding protein